MDQAECLETDCLFEDDTFGPEYNEEWKRPQNICDDPCLFDEGSSRFDVVQVSPVKYTWDNPDHIFFIIRVSLEIAGLSPL